MIKSILFGVFCFYLSSLQGQDCGESSLITYDVRAKDTDDDIPWELVKHKTYFNPECPSRNLLLIHLVGSLDNPGSTTQFPALAANNGYHVLVIKYPNMTAAQTACASSEDSNCYEKFRLEIIMGDDYSEEVEVDLPNSILNRIEKLILHMNDVYPLHNWSQYLDANGDIEWVKTVFSGHSQGGGHAALIAKHFRIHRALMFAAPNDYSEVYEEPAAWLQIASQTDIEDYYGFNNVQDNVVDFEDQYDIWRDLGLNLYGDTVNIEHTPYPYNESRQLVVSRETTGFLGDHSLMIIDDYLPVDQEIRVIFEDAWKYMLGIEITSNVNNIVNQMPTTVYPNPTESKLFLTALNDEHSVSFSIFNMHTELILRGELSKSNEFIDVSSLEEGIYLLRIGDQYLTPKYLSFVKI